MIFIKEFHMYIIYMIELIALLTTIVPGFFQKGGFYTVKNLCNYYGTTMIVMLSASLVYIVFSSITSNLLVQSGIPLCLLLLLFGLLVDPIYSRLSDKTVIVILNEQEKAYIWGWSAILCSVFMCFYNVSVATTLIAIFLGKYIWYDSTRYGKMKLTNILKGVFGELCDSDNIRYKNIIRIKSWILGITVIQGILLKMGKILVT